MIAAQRSDDALRERLAPLMSAKVRECDAQRRRVAEKSAERAKLDADVLDERVDHEPTRPGITSRAAEMK